MTETAASQGTGQLTGKTCIVMGVQNQWSIAWQIAEAMANAGANVAITYVDDRAKANAEKLAGTVPGMKTFVCDVTQDESIARLAEALRALRRAGLALRAENRELRLAVQQADRAAPLEGRAG